MATVIVDETLRSFLAPLKEPTEFKDTGGKLLGFFTPALEGRSREEEKNRYAEVRQLFDPEEIQRRKERSRNDPGRTLDQIMERLLATEKGK